MADSTGISEISKTDRPVISALLAVAVLTILGCVVVPDMMNKGIATGTKFLSETFGWLFLGIYAVNLLAVFAIGFSRYGSIRLGGLEKPEFSLFTWMSMFFTAALAVSLIFFAPADLIMQAATVPPAFPGITPGSNEAVEAGIAYVGVNWLPMFPGYSLAALGIMIAVYHKGMPFTPSSMFYPLLARNKEGGCFGGFIGRSFNFFSALAILVGTVAPIGLLSLSLGRSLEVLYGVQPTNMLYFGIIGTIMVVVTLAAVTGLYKGIMYMAKWNAYGLLLLGLAIMLLGPTRYIVTLFFSSWGIMLKEYPRLALWLNPGGDMTWLSYWPIFFAAFCIGWIPIMGAFLARISRGRTVREITVTATVILNVAFIAWYIMMAGASIHYDRLLNGLVTKALSLGGTEMVLWTWLNQVPFHQILAPLTIVITVLCLVTTADSIAITISQATTGATNPGKMHKALWSIAMCTMAAMLVVVGGAATIQGAIVIVGFPIAIYMAVYNFHCLPKILVDVETLSNKCADEEYVNVALACEECPSE